ncbi:MAG: response regulator [Candidatus Schekmanbacteria bacterium]|nr:MAG: response regulator [Candidatus Schekmanbacteria bacterium]
MRLRAVVFDDDPEIRNLLTKILELRGYEVLAFAEHRSCTLYENPSCYCKYKEACADVIITDLCMPVSTGIEFVRNQRKKGCKVKNIAIMSGDWTDSDVKKAKKYKCHIFYKPFGIEEINKWLDLCESRIDPQRRLYSWTEY